jgi:hypothetical protein
VRPAGARNYLRWRRSIDEHLELGRLTWDEYAMFSWLCTKADPRGGRLRTSWPTLAEQTTLSANHAGKLCRSLREKGYIAFPEHRGRRGSLVELAIDKFPLADGTYLMLSRSDGRTPGEVPAEVPAEVLAEVPAELDAQNSTTTASSPGGRERERKRSKRQASVGTPDTDQLSEEPRPERHQGVDPGAAYPPGVTPVRW